jgi:hypothetical protein
MPKEHHSDGSTTYRTNDGTYSETRERDGSMREHSHVETEYGWFGGSPQRVTYDKNGVVVNVQDMKDD